MKLYLRSLVLRCLMREDSGSEVEGIGHIVKWCEIVRQGSSPAARISERSQFRWCFFGIFCSSEVLPLSYISVPGRRTGRLAFRSSDFSAGSSSSETVFALCAR